MAWLDDVKDEFEKKRQAVEEANRKREVKLQRAMHEYRRLSPVVKRLLRDIGDLWWGRSFLFSQYRFDNENTVYARRWTIHHWNSSDVRFDVFLEGPITDTDSHQERFFFRVGYIITPDTSESELKQALREAARIGPYIRD